MNRFLRLLFSILVFSALGSCGGGGGGEGPTFPGLYAVDMVLLENSCGVGAIPRLSRLHTVNQNDRRIILQSGAFTFTGTVNDNNDGFDTFRIRPSGECIGRDGYSYSSPGASGHDFVAIFVDELICNNVTVCVVAYAGYADRRD